MILDDHASSRRTPSVPSHSLPVRARVEAHVRAATARRHAPRIAYPLPSLRVLMVTECSMSDNVAADVPDVEFIRPCNLCPHMKRITLPNIYQSLLRLEPRVEIDPAVAGKARRAVERMLLV